jgi:hypothetical protein
MPVKIPAETLEFREQRLGAGRDQVRQALTVVWHKMAQFRDLILKAAYTTEIKVERIKWPGGKNLGKKNRGQGRDK